MMLETPGKRGRPKRRLMDGDDLRDHHKEFVMIVVKLLHAVC